MYMQTARLASPARYLATTTRCNQSGEIREERATNEQSACQIALPNAVYSAQPLTKINVKKMMLPVPR